MTWKVGDVALVVKRRYCSCTETQDFEYGTTFTVLEIEDTPDVGPDAVWRCVTCRGVSGAGSLRVLCADHLAVDHTRCIKVSDPDLVEDVTTTKELENV